jgi:hypothetical protein
VVKHKNKVALNFKKELMIFLINLQKYKPICILH